MNLDNPINRIGMLYCNLSKCEVEFTQKELKYSNKFAFLFTLKYSIWWLLILSVHHTHFQQSGTRTWVWSLKKLFLQMANDNLVSFQVPRLTKENYSSCCIRMKALHGWQDVWDIASNGYEEPESDMALNQAQRETLKNTRKIIKRLSPFFIKPLMIQILKKNYGATTTHQAWKILYNTYKGVHWVKKVRL